MKTSRLGISSVLTSSISLAMDSESPLNTSEFVDSSHSMVLIVATRPAFAMPVCESVFPIFLERFVFHHLGGSGVCEL